MHGEEADKLVNCWLRLMASNPFCLVKDWVPESGMGMARAEAKTAGRTNEDLKATMADEDKSKRR